MTTPSSIEERIAHLEGSFEQIERRLGTLEQDIRAMRTEVVAGFNRLDARIDRLEGRMYQLMFALLGAVAASILATVLTRLL